MKSLLVVAAATLIVSAVSVGIAAELPAVERQKIEQLIQSVEKLADAVFVRNGRDYDARSAARFMRGKWEANQRNISSAKEFIVKAASVSTTTGKPYLIRYKNGKEITTAEFLTGELARLEQ